MLFDDKKRRKIKPPQAILKRFSYFAHWLVFFFVLLLLGVLFLVALDNVLNRILILFVVSEAEQRLDKVDNLVKERGDYQRYYGYQPERRNKEIIKHSQKTDFSLYPADDLICFDFRVFQRVRVALGLDVLFAVFLKLRFDNPMSYDFARELALFAVVGADIVHFELIGAA